ncbi:MAG: holo-ACP synthase [Chloroflexi bacterium]|nr:holo-ACP synthase [Chloroflexota bacterium]
MLAVGVDIVEIRRIQEVVNRWGGRFLGRVYTAAELAYCRGRPPELAARFAAKEAVLKALGTGLQGPAWCEIEILPDPQGRPQVYLHGRAREIAQTGGLTRLALSLSHSWDNAIALVVALNSPAL